VVEAEVAEALKKRGLSLAVAESCTGGLLAMRITEVPGASGYFRGGVVAYSNEVKEQVLGVAPELLRAHGAVSPQCAQAMAEGVRKLLQADLGVAVTGIAGPAGGSPEKPVGLVYLAVAGPAGVKVGEFRFTGSRQGNRWSASARALELLLEYVQQP